MFNSGQITVPGTPTSAFNLCEKLCRSWKPKLCVKPVGQLSKYIFYRLKGPDAVPNRAAAAQSDASFQFNRALACRQRLGRRYGGIRGILRFQTG